MSLLHFIEIASDLDLAGLVWQPAIGDEISQRQQLENISVLVDPSGLTPSELRSTYLWLPTVEQMVQQFEARQAILFHAGLELSEHALRYKAVIQARERQIESSGESLRNAVGLALMNLLLADRRDSIH